ncbi:MAG TPA: hypothetical protein VE871_08015 [Longimicrobium sp.]|nr:hypothetical protein [Longimicrobium sp.]
MTLLAYSFLADPDPLQAGGMATLTLIVSNPGRKVVTAASIAVMLPVGTNAKALTPDASGIQSQVPAGWNVSQSGGELTLRPATPEAAGVADGGLSFVFARIQLNAEPGTVAVTITETASSPAQPAPQPSTAVLALDKFPRQFSLGGLTATPLRVEPGGSATLMWSGSPANYTLYYDPGSAPVDVRVGSAGPYVAANLLRPAGVTFTLRVSVNVPGQDLPLLLQRQVHVDVAAVTIDALEASPSTVGPNGLARLSWRTSNAASVTLDPGNQTVPASGVRYVTVAPGAGPFTLTARGSQPRWSAQQQRTVSVDPAIVATAEGYVQVGGKGDDGANGAKGWPNGQDGTAGRDGGDVSLTGRIPPLDPSSRPARVLPIRLTGGDGGRGGNGGRAGGGEEAQGPGGRGANGGRGGNATVDVAFDETLPPVQYLVQAITAGHGGGGGGGGEGMGGYRAPDGAAGGDGVVSVAFHEPAALAEVLDDAPLAPAAGWALQSAPDPLQAGAPASLTLVGTAPGGTVVVELPVGAGADALTTDPAGIVATAPAGWTVGAEGGVFTFTPLADTASTADTADTGPFAFTFAAIAVNDVPGTCTARVDGAALPLAKFPPGFSVSTLVAEPARVDAGGAATLMWSGAPADYALRWDAGAGPVRQAVPPAGSLTVEGLDAAPGVVFILAATLPGGLVLERRTYVKVTE